MDRVLTAEFGAAQILIVIVIAVVVFGGRKLGDLGKGLGEGIRNFKDVMKDEEKKDGQSGSAGPTTGSK